MGGVLNKQRIPYDAVTISGKFRNNTFQQSSAAPAVLASMLCPKTRCWINQTSLEINRSHQVDGTLQFCFGEGISMCTIVQLAGTFDLNTEIFSVHQVGHTNWGFVFQPSQYLNVF